MNPEAVVFGDVTIDIVARVESYPPPGGDVQPLETRINIGGTSLNTAVMLARLGVRTALIARVGPDFFGDHILRQMEQEGLSNRWMQRDPLVATGLVYIAVTPDGQRTMLGGAGANRNLTIGDAELEMTRAARWLHVTSYNVLAPDSLDATLRAFRVASDSALTSSFDIGLAPIRLAPSELTRAAAKADILLPSEDTDHVPAVKQIVIRKRGAAGCDVSAQADSFRVPAFPIKVVDSTGAGDAFDAGFIAGRLRGLNFRQSALLGNACGAAACTVLGAGEALPSKQVVLDLLRAHPPAGWQDDAKDVLQRLAIAESVSMR
jgi:sugar/nucleoside kinase (ribokinase family)